MYNALAKLLGKLRSSAYKLKSDLYTGQSNDTLSLIMRMLFVTQESSGKKFKNNVLSKASASWILRTAIKVLKAYLEPEKKVFRDTIPIGN